MNCKYCNSTELYLKETEKHIGLYCANAMCNKWQTWLGKKVIGNYSMFPRYGINEQPRLRQPQMNHDTGFDGHTHYVDLEQQVAATSYPTYVEPQQEETPYQESYIHHQEWGYGQPSNLQQQPRQEPKQQFNYNTMCVACISGVIPSLGENHMYTMQYKKDSGLLIMSSKKTNEVVYSASVSHCPVCGTSNKKAVV